MKRVFYIALILLATPSLFAQKMSPKSWEAIEKDVIEWRRHIHQHPELSFKEVETSKFVEEQLLSFGNIEVSRPTPTSVLGILKGDQPGKKVGFRADMDALPIQEETGLPFTSVCDGVSHACGHDAHTAMLLGTAKVLSQMKSQIKGTIYFIFQHAEEEGQGGAIEIIQSGALEGLDAIFGAHVLPNFPVGNVVILPEGPASTAADGFFLTIKGKGSHGSMPHLGIDPLVTGAQIVTTLQTVISRSVMPGEMAVVTVGKFVSGNAPNVIPDKAELAATIRTTTDHTRVLIEKRIKTIIEHECKAMGADYDLDYILGYPAIINDGNLRNIAEKAAIQAVGKEAVQDGPIMTASEDFARYRDVAPIYFLNIGVGEGVANHNPGFNLDEAALINGVKAEVAILLEYLSQR